MRNKKLKFHPFSSIFNSNYHYKRTTFHLFDQIQILFGFFYFFLLHFVNINIKLIDVSRYDVQHKLDQYKSLYLSFITPLAEAIEYTYQMSSL